MHCSSWFGGLQLLYDHKKEEGEKKKEQIPDPAEITRVTVTRLGVNAEVVRPRGSTVHWSEKCYRITVKVRASIFSCYIFVQIPKFLHH